MPKYVKDVIILNNKVSSKKRKRVLDELDELENSFVLPSTITNRVKVKEDKESKNEKEKTEEVTDDWLNAIVSIKAPKPNKKMKKKFEGFITEKVEGASGKKGKKKKGEAELINYHKEFEPELNALKNLFSDQSKFSMSLQQMYDEIGGKKATARGIGKFTIDLVEAVSQSRATTLSVLDKIIGTKKTISELDMKQKEKFGKKAGSEFQDNSQFASAFLAQAIKGGKDLNSSEIPFDTGYNEISNYDDIGSLIESKLFGVERDPSVDAFLKYETSGVEVYIMMDDENNWDFIAEDRDGNILEDYPLPSKKKLTFYMDMNKAVNEFGEEYKIRSK